VTGQDRAPKERGPCNVLSTPSVKCEYVFVTYAALSTQR
jgi:hypothetical protein